MIYIQSIIAIYLIIGLIKFLFTVKRDIKNGYFYVQGYNKPHKFIASMFILTVFWIFVD